MVNRIGWTVVALLLPCATPLQAGAVNPETFESYGIQGDPWSPTQGVEGWVVECHPEEFNNCDNTYEIGNFGPNSGSGTDLAFRQVGSKHGRALWYATLDIADFPQQIYSFDFRLVEGTTDQIRTRIITGPLTEGNFRSPGEFDLDTISGFPFAELHAGDIQFPSPAAEWTVFQEVSLGDFPSLSEWQGSEAPWYTYELELDYARPQVDQANFAGLFGQSRVRVRRQDGSMDFDWSPWVDMGLDNTQIQRFQIIRNGTIDIDNLSLISLSLPCDFDTDNLCDEVDINLLAAAVRDGTSDAKFNVDGQGDPNIPDNADFDFYITDDSMLSTGFGDHNLDFDVDFPDFVFISNNFGMSGTGWGTGNGNTDNETNFIDFVRLSNNFGMNFSSGATIPEPAMVCTLGFLSLVLAWGRPSNLPV